MRRTLPPAHRLRRHSGPDRTGCATTEVLFMTLVGRLDAALAETEPNAFLRALAYLDERYNGIAFEQRPEPLSLFGCVFAFCYAVTGEGIWKYLAESDGDGFHELSKISRRIGAVRTAEYL